MGPEARRGHEEVGPHGTTTISSGSRFGHSPSGVREVHVVRLTLSSWPEGFSMPFATTVADPGAIATKIAENWLAGGRVVSS